MNTSEVENNKTANTANNVAKVRAELLAKLGVTSVIELCVGPSLKTLEPHYTNNGITVTGNDIESRWKDYYPEGNWVIGDALTIDLSGYDACVFAPPLSEGCTGKRCDYLSIEEVTPSYYSFIDRGDLPEIVVLTLPGKTFSLKEDRSQYYKFMHYLLSKGYHNAVAYEMKGNKNKITKYVDLYLINN